MSLVVQWLRLGAPNAGGVSSIRGQGAKMLHATWCGQKRKEEKETRCVLEPTQWPQRSTEKKKHKFWFQDGIAHTETPLSHQKYYI